MEMPLLPFRCSAIRPRVVAGHPHRSQGRSPCGISKPKPYEINKLTPEPAPTLSQLLAFYLEAGVDCALSEEPVDRLADSRRD